MITLTDMSDVPGRQRQQILYSEDFEAIQDYLQNMDGPMVNLSPSWLCRGHDSPAVHVFPPVHNDSSLARNDSSVTHSDSSRRGDSSLRYDSSLASDSSLRGDSSLRYDSSLANDSSLRGDSSLRYDSSLVANDSSLVGGPVTHVNQASQYTMTSHSPCTIDMSYSIESSSLHGREVCLLLATLCSSVRCVLFYDLLAVLT